MSYTYNPFRYHSAKARPMALHRSGRLASGPSPTLADRSGWIWEYTCLSGCISTSSSTMQQVGQAVLPALKTSAMPLRCRAQTPTPSGSSQDVKPDEWMTPGTCRVRG